jgi:hypothetical protein
LPPYCSLVTIPSLKVYPNTQKRTHLYYRGEKGKMKEMWRKEYGKINIPFFPLDM